MHAKHGISGGRPIGRTLFGAALGAVVLAGINAGLAANAAQAAGKPTIIKLTQTGCQFVEPERGVDHMYKTTRKADCEKINGRTEDKRLAKHKVMKLKAGTYVFRVKNKNVPYMLGFYLRGQGLRRFTLPGTSGGGLHKGVSRDYKITLKPGKYIYSCPLNTTPNYEIHVEG